MHTHKTHFAHLLYFATYPLFMAGALTRPLLMHDKSKFCAKSFVTWLSSFISCTLPFRRCFLLSADDLSSESSCESKRKRKGKEGENYVLKLLFIDSAIILQLIVQKCLLACCTPSCYHQRNIMNCQRFWGRSMTNSFKIFFYIAKAFINCCQKWM